MRGARPAAGLAQVGAPLPLRARAARVRLRFFTSLTTFFSSSFFPLIFPFYYFFFSSSVSAPGAGGTGIPPPPPERLSPSPGSAAAERSGERRQHAAAGCLRRAVRRRPRCPGAVPEACGRPGAPSGACAWRRPSAGCRRDGGAAARRRRGAAGSRQVRLRGRAHVLRAAARTGERVGDGGPGLALQVSALSRRLEGGGRRSPESALERELQTRRRGCGSGTGVSLLSQPLRQGLEAPRRVKQVLRRSLYPRSPVPAMAVHATPGV